MPAKQYAEYILEDHKNSALCEKKDSTMPVFPKLRSSGPPGEIRFADLHFPGPGIVIGKKGSEIFPTQDRCRKN